MKKVGIITMHRPVNVGCYLQAYGLQEAIIRQGCDCEIIDYHYPNAFHGQLTFKMKIARMINKQLKRFLGGGAFELSEKRFNDFFHNQLKLSAVSYKTIQELQQNPPEYDLYCIGSDQVWNPNYIKGDPTFFCEFTPDKKPIVSYASSFGVTSIPQQYHDLYKRGLGRLQMIGVRELSGVEIVKELTGKEAQFVVDPTLLLTAEQWSEKAAAIDIDDPYILCYGCPYPNVYVEKLALHIQKKTGLKVIHLFGLPWQRFDKNILHVYDVGPLEFLSWIKNAKLVLTTSFHGTIFSTGFKVPFYSVYYDKEGGSRQINILDRLQLQERGILAGSELPSGGFFEIDFEKAHHRLDAMRESSYAYLKKMLSLSDSDSIQ